MIYKNFIIGILILSVMTGCASSESGKVVRVDPREVRDIDANYGSEDLHIFTRSMIQSMLLSKPFYKSKPFLALKDIEIGQGVDEHMDTRLITNSIRTNLLKTTKVHFIDTKYAQTLDKKAVKSVDYILSGDIHAIKKSDDKNVDNFYMLSLKLTDSQNSVIVWTEDKEIRKVILK
ncbi:MAG TPA: hypothetical protein ENK66_03540 [Arcobacter sp.]|nr:hypothetical protein [Arcobacter sp.]